MAELVGKRFESPDEVRELPAGKGRVELVDLNGHAAGRGTFEPGWRWSEHMKPLAGTDSCQVEHIGYVLQGRMALKMDDDTEREFGLGDTFHMPSGHDMWIVGDEACVLLDFGGLKGTPKRVDVRPGELTLARAKAYAAGSGSGRTTTVSATAMISSTGRSAREAWVRIASGLLA